jgi:hypothetical protein
MKGDLYFPTVELVRSVFSTVSRPSSRLQACLANQTSLVFCGSPTLLTTECIFGTLVFWGAINDCGYPLYN